MTIRLSTAAKNAILDTGYDAVFNSGILEGRTGAQPASANDAATGTLLFSMTLPADAFGAASGGSKAKLGTWQDTSADAAGTAGWYRLKQAGDAGSTDGTDERQDGSITATGGGGDLQLDNTSIASGQQVTVNTFTVSL
jgi:hypothetical protein